ncbi:LysR family transcriptional regulator [Roseomonas mucosa]
MIDLRSLEIFYWVATLESFGRAAERLYTTQPAVSQRVAGLETELGHRLFERSGRSIHLTPKGRHLLGYAERLLRLHTEMVQTIAAGEQLGGVVRLGVAETIVQTWLSDFIEQVNTRHPTVTFEIEVAITPDLKQALLRQEMDLAFVTGPLSEPELMDLELISYPIRFLAGRRTRFEEEPVPPEALRRHPLITFPKNTVNHRDLRQAFQALGLGAPRIHASASLATMVRMAVDGIGIAAIPPVVAQNEIARGELRLIETPLRLPLARFTASYRPAPDAVLVPKLAGIAVSVAHAYAQQHGFI